MYILVEIIHTEFQYISLIEMQKYNWNRKRIEKRKTWKKKRPFVPVGNTNRDKRVRQPCGRWLHLLSRTGVPGWETGTTAVSQPGQINVFVVVVGVCTCVSPGKRVLGLLGSSSVLSARSAWVPNWVLTWFPSAPGCFQKKNILS